MRQSVSGINNRTSTRIGIGERTDVIQPFQHGRQASAEISTGLVKVNIASIERDFLADLVGDLNTVIQVAIGIDALQQNQQIGDPLISRRLRSGDNTQRRQFRGTDCCPQRQIADEEANGFIRLVAESPLSIGLSGRRFTALVIQPGDRTVNKHPGARGITIRATATTAQTSRQGQKQRGQTDSQRGYTRRFTQS